MWKFEMIAVLRKAFGNWRLERGRRQYGAREGDALRKYNRLRESAVQYSKYLKKKPNDVGVIIKLANVFMDLGLYEDALELTEGIVLKRPNYFRARFICSELLEILDRNDEARSHYVSILSSNPNNKQAIEGLNYIEMKNNSFEDFNELDFVEINSIDNCDCLIKISVLIQSNNKHEYIVEMVESIFSNSDDPSLINVIIADHLSDPPLEKSIFSSNSDSIFILNVGGPFNWSKTNNTLSNYYAAAEVLLFANNDMEILTQGWDTHIRDSFSRPDIGIVGARLVYPEGHLQHGGIVLGVKDGEPLHEGLRELPGREGPNGRWVKRRLTSAVTGGFLAIRKVDFDRLGRFDADEMPISCSDIDLCLRASSSGLLVVYDGRIVVRHHESLSRGHATSPDDMAQAKAEMEALLGRWGAYAQVDPFYHPRWVRRGLRLFAGLRQVPAEELDQWAVAAQRYRGV